MNKSVNILWLMRPKMVQGFSIEQVYRAIYPHFAEPFHVTMHRMKSAYNPGPAGVLFANGFEIVHLTGGNTYWAIWYRLLGKKVVVTYHDTHHYDFDLSGGKKMLHGWIFYRLGIYFSHVITTVSGYSKNKLIKNFNVTPNKIMVIHNPVNRIFINVGRDLSHKPEKFTIILVGTKKNKNIETVLNAVKELPVRLIIVGALSPLQKNIIKDFGLDVINETGVSNDRLKQLYQMSHLLCFPSLREGFGLPVIEAQAMGLPVLVANSTSLPEVTGQSAIWIDPGDINGWKNAIVQMMNDKELYLSYVEKGRENVKRFYPEKIADQLEEIYLKLLS
ncbi:MAG: hypothetical protein KatS3mg028_1602 [Bacteroidia bacterium]|nr:MAG: hypothetical protein KatS3mg028_1602 [Bacteroidia bacterium]